MDLKPITRIEKFLDAIINNTTPPESIERIERFLEKIGGVDVEVPEPITRIETYLAKIAGEDVDVPEPITRIETYLAKAAGEDVEIPDPITRIEYFLSELSGGSSDPLITLTGKIISFIAKAAKPFKSTQVAIEPVQSGTGDPSPDNVRPISGWTEADMFNEAAYDPTAQPKVSLTFGSTVYGGQATDNGDGSWTVVANMAAADLGSLAWTYSSNGYYYALLTPRPKYPSASEVANAICSIYPVLSYNVMKETDKSCSVFYAHQNGVNLKDSAYSNAQALTTAVTGQTLVYELATPITFTVSGETLTSLVGTNNAWADTGNITAEVYGTAI